MTLEGALLLASRSSLRTNSPKHRLSIPLRKNKTKGRVTACLKTFDKIAANMNLNDVFILYLAGHGVTSKKDGLFYFLTYDTGMSDALEEKAISVNEIKTQLSKLNTNKFLIMLDTCGSGSVIDHTIQNEGTLQRLSHGANHNYIVASSSTQVALEGYRDHGVFTYSILDAFDNAYFGNNNILTVASLAAYVESIVPKITKDIAHYEQTPEKYLSGKDFEIAERQ